MTAANAVAGGTQAQIQSVNARWRAHSPRRGNSVPRWHPVSAAPVPTRQVREQHVHGLGRGRRKSLLAGRGLSEDFPLSPIVD